jgi:hypothetical protein
MNLDLFVLVSDSFPYDQLHRCIYRSKTSSSLAQNCCSLKSVLFFKKEGIYTQRNVFCISA